MIKITDENIYIKIIPQLSSHKKRHIRLLSMIIDVITKLIFFSYVLLMLSNF